MKTGNSWFRKVTALAAFAFAAALGLNAQVQVVAGSSANFFADDNGVLHITNLAGFKAFRDQANTGALNGQNTGSAGHTKVQLDADIDLDNEEWTPINTSCVDFDGQNHVIANLRVTGNGKNVGLFGAASISTVKNLTVSNAVVVGINHVAAIAGDGLCGHFINCKVYNATITTAVYNNDDGDKAGAICGYLSGESDAEVTDCTVENCTITGYRDVGGAVGYANGTASVTGTTVKNTVVLNDRSNNYKNYTTDAEFDVNKVIGETSSNATVSGNSTTKVTTAVYTDGFLPGTDGIYHITNLAGFKAFRDQANTGALNGQNTGSAGHTKVQLDADIDLNNEEWTPITMSCIDFDGGEHVVSNLKVTGNEKNVGLFGAASISTVKNLTVSNAVVVGINHVAAIAGDCLCGHFINCKVYNATITTAVYNNDDGDKAGAICGYLSGESDAEVTDCTVENCTVTGYRDVGGAVGYANGTASVTGTTVKNTVVLNDRSNNYKNYTTDAEFDINKVIGETSSSATVEKNTTTLVSVAVVGSGLTPTTSGVWHIENLAGFKAFRDSVNGGTKYAGQTIQLDANIDLGNEEWTPIVGDNEAVVFDGNGKTISNLKITQPTASDVGLFQQAVGWTIKNLTIDGAVVSGKGRVGTIVGQGICAHVEGCTVKNATVTTSVYNNDDGDKAGAIVGYLSGESTAWVKDCTVENCTITGYRDVGGVVGYANGTAVVTGNTVKDTAVINDRSVNYKNYTTDAAFDVNAVVGEKASAATVDNNTTTDVTVKVAVAKVDGAVYTDLATALNAAKADGSVCELLCDVDLKGAAWTPIADFQGDFDGKGYSISGLNVDVTTDNAGLFGNASEGVLRNVTLVSPSVKGTGSCVAALVGAGFRENVYNVVVTNATVVGGNQYVGGVCGGTYCSIVDSKVLASTITGKDQVGGVIGYICGAGVKGCTVTGNAITATAERAGGLVGKINIGDSATQYFSDNVISGSAKAPDMAGGIAAQIMGGDADYEIRNNDIDVVLSAAKVSPIGVLRPSQPVAFTGALEANITGTTWSDATTNANSYVYTAAETGAGDQVINRDNPSVIVDTGDEKENTATVVTKKSTTEAQTASVPQEAASITTEQVTVGGKTTTVAEQIEQTTKVEGVKLTTNETVVVQTETLSGVQAVVSEAKLQAIAITNEVQEATAAEKAEAQTFAEKIVTATKVEVKVEVTVTPTAYVAPEAEQTVGTMAFKLEPKATVKIIEDDVAVATQVVDVDNDMIDTNQPITVSIFTGFNPAQIVHRDDDNNVIETFSGDAIAYDAATGIATVQIDHFSTLTAYEEEVVDPLQPEGSTKVADGFYQNAATYGAAMEFYITNLNGFHFFRDLINQENGAIDDYIEKGFYSSTADNFYTENPFKGKTVRLLCDVDEGDVAVKPIGMTAHSRDDGKDKRYFYGIFDGCNHTVSNLRVIDDPPTTKHRVGLFGQVTRNTDVSMAGVVNLTVSNAVVSGYNYVGGFIGGLSGVVTLTNCHLTGSVTLTGTSSYVGGIVGHNGDGVDSQIVGCSVDVASGSTLTAKSQGGGIVGYMGGGDIIGCAVRGLAISASGSYVLGGIAGKFGATGCVAASNTVDSVTITAKDSGAAGSIVGSFGAAGQTLIDNTVVNTHVYDPGPTEVFGQCHWFASGDTTTVIGWNSVGTLTAGGITGGTYERLPDSYVASGYEMVAQGTTPETYVVQVAAVPVCKIGETEYTSLAAALADAEDDDVINVIGNISGETVTIPSSVTILGSKTDDAYDYTFDNVILTMSADKTLTVCDLAFTGNSYINANLGAALAVTGCYADVTPTRIVNGRSSFIVLGGNEDLTRSLALDIENNVIIAQKGNNADGDTYAAAIFGWNLIGNATIANNVFGSVEKPHYFIGLKFLNAAADAVWNFTSNTVYGSNQLYSFEGFDLYQNCSRANSYTANFVDNTVTNVNPSTSANEVVFGETEANTGSYGPGHATFLVLGSDNTLNGKTVTLDDLWIQSDACVYVGVGVGKDADGKLISGTYSADPTADVAEGYEAVAQGTTPETWTVAQKKVCQITIGEVTTQYPSLAAAVAAYNEADPAEETAYLIEIYGGTNEVSDCEIVQSRTKSLTIRPRKNGDEFEKVTLKYGSGASAIFKINGKKDTETLATVIDHIDFDLNGGDETSGIYLMCTKDVYLDARHVSNLTISSCAFTGDNKKCYAVCCESQSEVSAITIANCSAEHLNTFFAAGYVHGFSWGLAVRNTTVSDCKYFVGVTDNAGDVVIDNCDVEVHGGGQYAYAVRLTGSAGVSSRATITRSSFKVGGAANDQYAVFVGWPKGSDAVKSFYVDDYTVNHLSDYEGHRIADVMDRQDTSYSGADVDIYRNGIFVRKLTSCSSAYSDHRDKYFFQTVAQDISSDGVTTNGFDTLQLAFNYVQEGETIEVLAANSETITVTNTCSFTFKSNGYTMGAAPSVPEGYAFTVNGDGTCSYGVAKTYVAQIGETKYLSLQAAVNDATEGQTVKILVDTIDLSCIKANVNYEGLVDANGDPATTATGLSAGENAKMEQIVGCALRNFNFTTAVYRKYADGTTFENCRFTGTGTAGTEGDHCALRYLWVRGGFACTITNCVFEQQGKYAIHYDGADGGTVLVVDSTVTGTVAVNGDIEMITFRNCYMAGKGVCTKCNMNIYNKATYENCVFGKTQTDESASGILLACDDPVAIVEVKDCSMDAEATEAGKTVYDVVRKAYRTMGVVAFDAAKDDDGLYTNGTFTANLELLKTLVASGYDIVELSGVQDGYQLVEALADVCQNLTTTKQYADLQTAINEASAGDTIQMIADVDYEEIMSPCVLSIPSDLTITLDLNGKTIAGYNSLKENTTFMEVAGNLTITDLSANKDGKIVIDPQNACPSSELLETGGYGSYCISLTSGSLTVENGTIENKGTGGACYAIEVGEWAGSGDVTIKGGLVKAATTAFRFYECSCVSPMSLTMTGGKILSGTGSDGVLYQGESKGTEVGANITISGGEIAGGRMGIFVYGSSGDVNINVSGEGIVSCVGGYGAIYHGSGTLADGKNADTVTVSGGYVKDLNEDRDDAYSICWWDSYSAGGKLTVTGGASYGYVWCADTITPELSGGVYSAEPDGGYVKEGYAVAANTDAETKAAYPWTIVKSYAITYVIGTGSPEGAKAPTSPTDYVQSATETTLPKPTYTSTTVTFNGWLFGDGTFVANAIPAGTTGALTLTAQWTEAKAIKVNEEKTSAEPQLDIKVTQKWIDENVTEKKTETPTTEEIQATLNKVDANGNMKWQNYVIGLDATNGVVGVTAQNDDETTVTVAPNVTTPQADTGFTVKYSIDQVETNGAVVSAGAYTTADDLDIDLDKVESNAFFKVNVIVTKDGTEESTKIAATNTLGVLKVAKAPATAIVAVPWNEIGGSPVTVSNYVKTAGLSAGDELYVYRKDGTYSNWALDEDKQWYATGGQGIESDAETIERGSAVWIKRQDTSKPIVFFGQEDSAPTSSTLDAKKSETKPSWNIVAAPTVAPIDLNEKFNADTKEGVANDQVIVPTDGAPKNYTFVDNAWGYDDYYAITNKKGKVIIKSRRVTDDTQIPAGTGFWYLNSGSQAEVKW